MSLFKKLFGIKDNSVKNDRNEEIETSKKQAELTNRTSNVTHPDLEKFKQVPWMTELRLDNVSICLNAGYRPSNSLPTEFERKLRPSIEIAQRLNAIKALVLWLMVPQENLESGKF